MWRPPASDYAVVYCVPLRHRRPLRPAVPPLSVGRTTCRSMTVFSLLFGCPLARPPAAKNETVKGLLMASRYWVFFGHLSKFDYALAVIVRKRCGRVRDGRTERGASSWLADLAPPAGVHYPCRLFMWLLSWYCSRIESFILITNQLQLMPAFTAAV